MPNANTPESADNGDLATSPLAPLYSPAFCSLFASCFFEAQRRQVRHQKVTAKFAPTGGSEWQLSVPETLFGLSGLGIFTFDLFATSMGDQFLFVDADHPMVTYGRTPPPTEDAAIMKLRAQFPNVPELHGNGLASCDEITMHGICSIAAVATDALFYYRCPTSTAEPLSAVWVLVKAVAAHTPGTDLPANLASLAPPPLPAFGSYDAVIAAFDGARARGKTPRLNEFRINLLSMLNSIAFPAGVTMKALYVGFLERNGYQVVESPHIQVDQAEDQETVQGVEEQELVDVVAMVDGSPALTVVCDAIGRVRGLRMTLGEGAYAQDDYDL